MGLYFVKTPSYLKKIFRSMHWEVNKTNEPALYLTFDDGPTPETTNFVLDTLKDANAQACFFCIGQRVVEAPEIFQRLSAEGHTIGNHTWTHLKGWENDDATYIKDIARCAEVVKSELFRPPYGKIKISQAEKVRKDYKIVMWDVISGDFDPSVTAEKCLKNVLKNAGDGSIVVLHDSAKCADKMRYVLPRILDHFGSKGFHFPALTADHLS